MSFDELDEEGEPLPTTEDFLRARISRLEFALKFYANEHNYEKGHFTSEREIMADYGEKAREALEDPIN